MNNDLAALKLGVSDFKRIGAGLSVISRWNGASDITVAQHCCDMANLASAESKPYALIHDAEEAFIGDWMTPIKKQLRMIGAMHLIEEKMIWPLRQKISDAAGLNWPWPRDIGKEISHLDAVLSATEFRDTVRVDIFDRSDNDAEPLCDYMLAWSSTKAEREFAKMCWQLLPAFQGQKRACA